MVPRPSSKINVHEEIQVLPNIAQSEGFAMIEKEKNESDRLMKPLSAQEVISGEQLNNAGTHESSDVKESQSCSSPKPHISPLPSPVSPPTNSSALLLSPITPPSNHAHECSPTSKSKGSRRSIFGDYWGNRDQMERLSPNAADILPRTPLASMNLQGLYHHISPHPGKEQISFNGHYQFDTSRDSPCGTPPQLPFSPRSVGDLDCPSLQVSMPKPKSILRRHHSDNLPNNSHDIKRCPVIRRARSDSLRNIKSSQRATPSSGLRSALSESGGRKSESIFRQKDSIKLPMHLCGVAQNDCHKHFRKQHDQQAVHFDPRIAVCEFIEAKEEKSSDQKKDKHWFTDAEIEQFKKEAIGQVLKSFVASKIHASKNKSITSSGHQQTLPIEFKKEKERQRRKAFFTNPALQATDEDIPVADGSPELAKLLSREIRNVLVVEPNKGSRCLFRRAIRNMFPHVNVVALPSGEDALSFIEKKVKSDSSASENEKKRKSAVTFDIIITEERLNLQQDVSGVSSESCPLNEQLPQSIAEEGASIEDSQERGNQPMSGSQLLQRISSIEEEEFDVNSSDSRSSTSSAFSSPYVRKTLLIGVSSCIGQDCKNLRQGGADILWGKPTPVMDGKMRNQLLCMLLSKRGRSIFICDNIF